MDKALYNICKQEIAIKYKLGKTLVTGHREKYFIEAFELYLTKIPKW